MHVPKSAGTSVLVALERALSPDIISPKRQDMSLFCGGVSDAEMLDPGARALLVVDSGEIERLAEYPIVTGHFSLSTLLGITDAASIATVLREPRSRVLSNYAFWRLSSDLHHEWREYLALKHAQRPLDEFLAEPLVARATDNLVCRMLLDGDDRIPKLGFICSEDVDALASRAIAVLGTLGFVGILELGESLWNGLSGFFGASLAPVHVNTTASHGKTSDAPAASPEISTRTLSLLDARTAADAIVYREALRAAGRSARSAERLGAAAFASELVRFGDVAGSFASESRGLAQTIGELRQQLSRMDDERQGAAEEQQRTTDELQRTTDARQRTAEELRRARELLLSTEHLLRQAEAELRNHRDWLEGIQTSASWRLTKPARTVKRRLVKILASLRRRACSRARHA
jgi:hypothetical protein